MGRVLKVVHYGLGPIGQSIARLVHDTPALKIVGATDIDTDKAKKDLGTVLGLSQRLKVKVDENPAKLLRRVKADVAVLCTTSSARWVKDQALELVKRGMNVVTTCEELAFPTPENKAVFREIDMQARKKHVSVLATGVNPGYAMDALALMLTAPCTHVNRISVTRVVDAGTRRLSLQRKVGAGLSVAQFRRAMTEKQVRHVGLVESVHMLATGLGWILDKVEETLEPAIAPRDLETEHLRIPAGNAAGIRQTARGYRNGLLAVSLDLQMYVGADAPRDHVLIDGVPPIDMTIAGGLAGDTATAAMVVNCIPKLMAARPGLLTMRDIPLVHCFNASELKDLPKRKK
jgi:2,4-diaminopentanoate dehydrogenase